MPFQPLNLPYNRMETCIKNTNYGPGMWDGIYSYANILNIEEEAKPLTLVTEHHKNRKVTHPVELVTPFAGKTYCFSNYLKGIRYLPLKKMRGIFYDNSNNSRFHKRLKDFGTSNFAEFNLITDPAEPKVVETTSEYRDISWRCHEIYRTIQENLNGSEYTMIVEDDTEIPEKALPQMKSVLENEPRIGTVVGSVKSRRLKDRVVGIPVAWNYEISRVIPDENFMVRDSRIVNEKPYGVELIGSAHMACWLSRTALVKKIGFKYREDGLAANDQVWGYRLNKAGYWFAIDWGIKCKHWWKYNGVKGWY